MKSFLDRKEYFIKLAAIGPLWTYAVIFLLQLCSLYLGFGISNLLSLLGLISSFLVPTFFLANKNRNLAFTSLALSVSLVSLYAFVASLILDTSHDGQTYHQLAIASLTSNDFNYLNPKIDTPLLLGRPSEFLIPIKHYPEFPWITQAAIYKLTGDIESAKSLNLGLIISAFLLALIAAKKLGYSERNCFAASVATALNPVSTCQLWTFYVDGIFSTLCLIVLSSLLLFYLDANRFWGAVFAGSIVLLVNVKFTALVFVGCLVLSLLFAALYSKDLLLKKIFKLTLIASTFGVLLIGYHPYVTNFLKTGNPLYPVLRYSPLSETPSAEQWSGIRLQEGQQAKVLVGSIGPIKTTLSLASHSASPLIENAEFQPFWNGKLGDYKNFIAPDIRLGALGPLYAPVLLAALLLSALIKLSSIQQRTTITHPFALIAIIGILLSLLINPESWWARYSPQAWLLPFCVIQLLANDKLKSVFFAGLLFNSLAIAFVNTSAAYNNSVQIHEALNSIKPYRNTTLPGNTNSYFANELRLKRLDISLKDWDPTCRFPINFAGSTSRVCLPNELISR